MGVWNDPMSHHNLVAVCTAQELKLKRQLLTVVCKWIMKFFGYPDGLKKVLTVQRKSLSKRKNKPDGRNSQNFHIKFGSE